MSLQTKVISNVPDRLDGWEDQFEIPLQYSVATMCCISTGKLTSAARREIVQAVTSKLMNYCKYPTGRQIEVIASKLVERINGAKDALGTGYVRLELIVTRSPLPYNSYD